jgi:hypothetical protein
MTRERCNALVLCPPAAAGGSERFRSADAQVRSPLFNSRAHHPPRSLTCILSSTMFSRSAARSLASSSRLFSTSAPRQTKVAVLGAGGGIGQPLSLLLKTDPLVTSLSLYDIRGAPGVAADVSHVDTASEVCRNALTLILTWLLPVITWNVHERLTRLLHILYALRFMATLPTSSTRPSRVSRSLSFPLVSHARYATVYTACLFCLSSNVFVFSSLV